MLDIAQKNKNFYLGSNAKLILIIDGIDLFTENNTEDDLFWLPMYSYTIPHI